MMKVELTPGKYILAVSGGVDSMVLLDMLAKLPELELVVAHLNHGIRPDSAIDEELVRRAADNYGLPFAVARVELGPHASEDTARQVRYAFLEEVKKDFEAKAIITAHHQDDLIETAFINVLRGTGPQGLISLADTPNVKRPLLGLSKKELVAYAKDKRLAWREDETNQDTDYLRNYVRHKLVSRLSKKDKEGLLFNIEKVAKNVEEKNKIIATISRFLEVNDRLNRKLFAQLPAKVGNELLINWFKHNDYRLFDKKTVDTVNAFIRTAKTGASFDLTKELILRVDDSEAWLSTRGH